MRFSVVTTVFNGEDFIERAVESVVSQVFKDYEYIIVDNGSTDATGEKLKILCKKYSDYGIKIVSVSQNLGIGGGRNHGAKFAKGEYICFLDADDLWYDSKLLEVERSIQGTNYDVICHWEHHVCGSKMTEGKYRDVNNNDAYLDFLTNGNCLSTSAVAVRKNKFCEAGGFSEQLVSGEEDFDCWLRLANTGAVFHMIHKYLGQWIIRNDSASAKVKVHTDAILNMLDSHYAELSRREKDVDIRRIRKNLRARLLCGCGRVLSKNRDKEEGEIYYRKALKENPFYIKAFGGILLNWLHL